MRPELWFTGHYESDGKYIFAVCDHAPIVAHGVTEEEAYSRMRDAADVYVKTLTECGELEAAITSGLVAVKSKLKATEMRTNETILFETHLARA